MVGFAYRSHGHAIFTGDFGQGLATLHRVVFHHQFVHILSAGIGTGIRDCGGFHHTAAGIEFGVMVDNRVLVGHIGIDLKRGKHKRVRTDVAGNQVGAVLRIQHAQFVHRDTEHIADLLEMHTLGHVDSIGQNRFAGQRRRYVVLVVEVHYIVCGDERGHVTAGFRGKVGIDGPEILGRRTGTAHGFVHIAGTAVVSGDGQRPVAENIVKFFQIAGGGIGRCVWVATLVDQRIDLEALAGGRGHHELPQARGTCARDGVGVQGAFNHGQVFEFQRHAVAVQGLLENGHIIQAHAEHVLHQLLAAVGVHVDIIAYHRVEGHLNHRGQRTQAAYQVLVGHGHRLAAVGLAVEIGIVAQVPVLFHPVDVGLETFRIHNRDIVEAVAD